MHRPPLLTIKAILQPRNCYHQSKVGHQTHNYQQYHHHPHHQQQQQHTRRMEETQTKPKRALDSPPTKLINTTENQSSKRPCHQDERIIDSTQNTDSTPSVVTQETPNAVVDPEKQSKNNGQPNQQKPKNQAKKPPKLKKGKKNNKADQNPLTISEQSLELSIKDLMGAETYETLLVKQKSNDKDAQPPWKESGWDLEKGKEIEVEISALSSFGDGIAISPQKNWALIIPFCVPGDVVRSRIFRHNSTHSIGDLISVLKPGELRNDSLVRCKYFGKCSGCQYQMIDYQKQLDLKRVAVQKAFEHFSGLDQSAIPTVELTLQSPKEYEYRTKLTPHFELPRQWKNKKATQVPNQESGQDYHSGPGGLAIGLAEKGRRRVIDIEECPLGTKTINEKLTAERTRVQSTIQTYKRGATLLLRESLIPLDPTSSSDSPVDDESRICVTDHKTIVREKVLDKNFEQNAGSFFQNNPSILGPFMSYMIEELIPTKTPRGIDEDPEQHEYLVDAYCGSGLFSISLAQFFTKTTGIELSSDSLRYAKRNADLNKITNASFIAGEAEAIFKDLSFPAEKTTIIIDPPRKGCSQEFLDQLLSFKPKRIIYISCNVNSQAQDIKYIKHLYKLQRLRGLDFFPQTYHCESVALLHLIE
ncbi:uncharacterized protein PGTG_14467 [Puccinia graminis f. sp. tritici CRL 75-36-700-3]|uniref:TRAM domain-containing protein n=1 Tax=Puccinia graminis f. sp. tritici (strain CRL 75-36-700-3 / race SCCL) TaxID=418459 RepID=E3KVP3_PUCGT|nr:uncharacterized protein PGTG_14467 [Puccinia graminis f. sp. tritici CRL 75-36-700-3]EFP88383.2 hypothetical protein PGTG_14467 [Puccinia graminis f. sp. tritici CRL 75-36-700-3]